MDARIEQVPAAPPAGDGDARIGVNTAVFSGDALLATGPAAHDGAFPDFPSQLTAIGERLLVLPGRTRVLPGHGAETTVAVAERRFDSWVTAGPTRPPGPLRTAR